MGGDCCGGGPADAAAAALNGLALKNQPPKENQGGDLPWDQVASSKKHYYDRRVQLFETFKARQDAALEAAKAAAVPIKVILPDGSTKEGIKGVTSPLDIANMISKSLGKKTVVAEVDGQSWDVFRPLESDCTLKLFDFKDAEGKDAFWHSSAHILGQALELEFGADLTIGPAIEEGFYYDCFLGDRSLGDPEKEIIVNRMKSTIKEKQRFERAVLSKAEALEMFSENKFKVEMISAFDDDTTITCYRVGPMVDLCTGPHVPNTGVLKNIAINQMSRAFWRADAQKDSLQRVYGITFPDDKDLKDYLHRMEEAKKRDHRNVGLHQKLFFFNPMSPGSCFFLPHGARIYNNLMLLIREKYWEYQYDEVVTPNIYNFDLWKTSGHADHYKENMFSFSVEKSEFGLKPMNCPGHCLMFAHEARSYRDLPLRFADFGVLHRNEFSGALSGLTRVRRFQQDDAHIFCRTDQVIDEISNFLKMLGEVYGIFGLEYTLALSTRPEGYLGEIEQWNAAEDALKGALDGCGRPWELNPADGAFYGPKIDITVYDALKRKFQCATVQLDFQLPIRFGLEFQTAEGTYARPVIVHRAILGSVERMFAILTEHYAGKWPLWLSPRQVMVVPISDQSYDYASEVGKIIHDAGFHVKVDLQDNKMQKKVREAQVAQFNYILVVGEQEKEARTVNVRTRDNHVHGQHKLDDVLEILKAEAVGRSLASLFGKEEGNGKA
jgi:threonyl-tRNA synthetase